MRLRCDRETRFDHCFNPRPAGWPGDASKVTWPTRQSPCFNPRPAGWPGDAIAQKMLADLRRVSIRARPGGRAMPNKRLAIDNELRVSIRARPGGRAMQPIKGRFQAVGNVSIRARPGGRAMPAVCAAQRQGQIVSIRARPGGRAMQNNHALRQVAHFQFQSAPGRVAGRCTHP